ncbi:hypothetical protein OUZ56_003328 [Daphnia magna]|uniref:CCHC-type domain-containing protein n=1 Tax=Daphnia magna TaxID=35525 RepID=A0ABR0A8E9_9CRUS|nr:hypothetical protein OUZ56_003328 [Daphnia magna]
MAAEEQITILTEILRRQQVLQQQMNEQNRLREQNKNLALPTYSAKIEEDVLDYIEDINREAVAGGWDDNRKEPYEESQQSGAGNTTLKYRQTGMAGRPLFAPLFGTGFIFNNFMSFFYKILPIQSWPSYKVSYKDTNITSLEIRLDEQSYEICACSLELIELKIRLNKNSRVVNYTTSNQQYRRPENMLNRERRCFKCNNLGHMRNDYPLNDNLRSGNEQDGPVDQARVVASLRR